MNSLLLTIYNNSGKDGEMVIYGMVTFLGIIFVVCWLMKYGHWFKKK